MSLQPAWSKWKVQSLGQSELHSKILILKRRGGGGEGEGRGGGGGRGEGRKKSGGGKN